MNNAKSPKNVSLKNQLELWLFCTLIGAVAGALVWILLKIMAVGTEFLWKWLPGKTSVPYYTILQILFCTPADFLFCFFSGLFIFCADRNIHLKFRLCTGRTDHNGAVVFQQKLQYMYSVSSRTTSSKSVISLRPLTCHIPVIPGLVDIRLLW